jgi:hypothetical protein
VERAPLTLSARGKVPPSGGSPGSTSARGRSESAGRSWGRRRCGGSWLWLSPCVRRVAGDARGNLAPPRVLTSSLAGLKHSSHREFWIDFRLSIVSAYRCIGVMTKGWQDCGRSAGMRRSRKAPRGRARPTGV